jgi:hypothetical protein
MKWKNALLVFLTVFISLFMLSISTASSSALFGDTVESTPDTRAVEDQIKQAILNTIYSSKSYTQGGLDNLLQVSDIRVSNDQLWGTAWIIYYDSQIDAVIPTEPALTLTHFLDNEWQVYLPSDTSWKNVITQLPDDLLSQESKEMWLTMDQGTVEVYPTQSGYFLPWHGGQIAYLSRSVGHDVDYSTAHYAFDFYIPGTTVCTSGGASLTSGTTGLNFNIYASRAGTVWGWDDSVSDCDHSKVNFIVLRNIDDPTIFQLYMHLSKNSIPPALKSVGAPVARGQFIAIADNTGASTGTHLHFQIEHQPTWPEANPYWNTALDVAFNDVDINGGRPRVYELDHNYCRASDICDVFRPTYLSQNYYLGDSTPPTGELNGITSGEIVRTPMITLNGWATDDLSGLDYGQLLAYFNNSWHNLGSHFNTDITYSWDLCDPDLPVPNGPVSVAMLLYDVAGNPAPRVGLSHFTKNYACPIPPTSCIPGQDQVTIFEDPDYQGGCVKYNVGNYPTWHSLDPLGNNDAESIMLGNNVFATLYSEENYAGHSQTITNTTAFMQYSLVPANTLSSLKVSPRSVVPQVPIPISPIQSTVFRQGDVIPLSWLNGGGATEYQVEIYVNSILYKTIPWQSDPVNYVDSLPAGSYSWKVRGRNAAGMSAWSGIATFSIVTPVSPPATETVPYSDNMENSQAKWLRDGLWRYTANTSMAHSGTYSWWYQNEYDDYQTDQPNSGSLTSPPISITSPGYYLRFYYRYQTETTGTNWDERWVQISVDDGPFTNLVQLSDDPQISETTSWLLNKAINLTPYVGHLVRIRFQFSTLDASANNYAGWGIDDFSITATPPPNCSENRQDDTYLQATILTYDPNLSVPGEICPNGDYDFYKFYGNTGDRIVADIDAMVNNSLLDAYLYLLDTDGKTVLAENDDEVYAERRDPLLGYTLTKNGWYYLKLKAWKHPLVGGDDYFYSLRFYEDNSDPVASITWPTSNIYLPDTNMILTAQVNDITDGVDRVEFFWHPTNWLTGEWVKLGTDWDGTDGWSLTFTPTGQPEGRDGAVFVNVYDKAGNWTSAAAWDLGIDKSPPTTAMEPLNATQPSNTFLLEWIASDNLSGIDYVEIQEKLPAQDWITLPPLSGLTRQYWIIGDPGNSYSYRMHGVDFSGNTEIYPTGAEVTTAIPNANILCSAPDSYDTSGNDNTPATASMIFVDGPAQVHNFCNPLAPNYQNDEDWVGLLVTNQQRYLIHAIAQSPPSATIISLFAENGETLLAEAQPAGFGRNTFLVWTSDRDGLVYLRLRHLDGRVIGNDVGSTFSVKTGTLTFLPIIQRK